VKRAPLIALLVILSLGITTIIQASTFLDFEDGSDAGWDLVTWFSTGHTVNATWTVVPFDQIRGNVYEGTGFGNGLAYRTDFWGGDVSVGALVSMANLSHPGAHSSLIARFDPSMRTGYEFGMVTVGQDHGTTFGVRFELNSLEGGSVSRDLATSSVQFQLPRYGSTPFIHLELTAIGNSLECYADGQPIFVVTDSAWAVGAVGALSATDCDFGTDCQVTFVDDFQVSPREAVPSERMTWSQIKQHYIGPQR
jgi:hypothetical protein